MNESLKDILRPWFDDPQDEWIDGDENEEEFDGYDEEGHEKFSVRKNWGLGIPKAGDYRDEDKER